MRLTHNTLYFPFSILFFLLVVSAPACAQLSLSLKRATELALQNNKTVKKAEKVAERAKANLSISRAVYMPQLGLTGSYERYKNDDQNIDDGDYLSRAQISQLLGRFGAVPADLDQAQVDVRKSGIEHERAKKEIVYAIRRLWHDITLTLEEIQQRSNIEVSLQKKLKGIQIKHEKKQIPFLTWQNTELELTEQQLALNQLQRRLDVDLAELVRLTGLDPLTEVVISESILDDDLTMEGAIEIALANRLDLRDLESDITRQQRLVNETEWNRLPELSASLRYRDAQLQIQQQLGNRTWDLTARYDPVILERGRDRAALFEREQRAQQGWEARFNFNVPLFDGGRTKNLQVMETAELERLQLELQEKSKQIRVEVRRAYRAVANAKERVEIEQKRVQIFEYRLRTIERVLEEITVEVPAYRGLTFDDAFQAQAQFTEAQRVFYQARRDYAQVKEQLRQEMGWIE